jgi:chromosomal replication initiation ATPase DnaA
MVAQEIINTINNILEVDIRSKTRKREVVYSRFIYYHLMRYKLKKNYSLTEIGSFLKKDHSSVLHGLKQFDLLINYDDFKYKYQKVILKLNENTLNEIKVCPCRS